MNIKDKEAVSLIAFDLGLLHCQKMSKDERHHFDLTKSNLKAFMVKHNIADYTLFEEFDGCRKGRLCTCCGKDMFEGYLAEYEYFCSDKCLHSKYSDEEWTELYDGGNSDEFYWTKWEEDNE